MTEVIVEAKTGRIPLGPRIAARHWWFGLVGAATLFVLWNNERFLINPRAPDWAHYNPIRWQLVPHGIGGALGLLLGALQFSTRIRTRFPYLHGVFGRLYIGGTFVAGPVAIWMAFINSPWFLVPFTIIQAATWMLFTGIAYRCIRRGDVKQHRQWMTRSYGIVLIFLEGRVLMAIPALARHGMDAIVLVNWACLAVTLVVTECLLNWDAVSASPNAVQRRVTHR
jgi:uncharacterized membrane protein